MKNGAINKIVFSILVPLFIVAHINADHTLSNFNIYKQEGSNTCWAACIRMVMTYYGVNKEGHTITEEDIRRLAFNISDMVPAPNSTNDIVPTADLLIRFLITVGHDGSFSSLEQNIVSYLLDNDIPILGGTG